MSFHKYSDQDKKIFTRTTRRFTLNVHDAVCYKKHDNGKLLLLLVIPRSMQEEVLKEVHKGLLTGNHFGETRIVMRSIIWYIGKAYKRQPKNV